MAENQTPINSDEMPTDAATASPASGTDSDPGTGQPGNKPARRKVYESTLLPDRKRLHVPPIIVIPAIFAVAAALFYATQTMGRHGRVVVTAHKIAFASDAGSPGTPHIWIAGDDGSAPVQLTSGAASEQSPAFSRDGSQITYLSTSNRGQNQVYVMDADGKATLQVTRNTGSKSFPFFSPSDSAVVGFIDSGAFSTAVVRTGSIDRILPVATLKKETPQSDDKTPDQAIPVVRGYSWASSTDKEHQGVAAIEDINGAQVMTVVPDLNADSQNPGATAAPLVQAQTLSLGWSPDGGLIAVALLGIPGLPKGHTLSALGLFDSTGKKLPGAALDLERDQTTGPQNPVFSPDGGSIVFERWDQPDLTSQKRLGLWIVPKDGTGPPKQIFKGDARSAQFLPDGKSVVFLSQRADGGSDLCRIGVDGTAFTRLSDGHSDVSSFTVSLQNAAGAK